METSVVKVGETYFFRTVTFHVIGKVERIVGEFVELSDSAWVADSGRFSTAIEKGELMEVEHIGRWSVNLSTVTDFGPWKHGVPKTK